VGTIATLGLMLPHSNIFMIQLDMHMQVDMHQDGMNRRKFYIVFIVMLLSVSLLHVFDHLETCKADTPPTLYVGKGEMYTRIQDALNNASDDYRIFVYNGTYKENLTINHRIDLFGEDRSITIINGNGSDTVITVNADHVNISHFTITNGGTTWNDSIIRVNAANSIITDNIISNGYIGICLSNSGGHFIYDNIIENNRGNGISLNHSNNNQNMSFNTIVSNGNGIYGHASSGNTLFRNDIRRNKANGIFLNRTCDGNYITSNNCSYNNHSGIYVNDYSDYSTVLHNQLYHNNDSGLKVENCSWCIIESNNTIRKNTNYGMMIIGSTNSIQHNIILNNKKDGMYCSADNNNTIAKNTIGFNSYAGIRLYNSTNDSIYSNEIYSNLQHGIYLDFFTIRNYVYNNYFHDNTINAMDKSIQRNHWNTTQHAGTNVIGGSMISGNYWDTYEQTSQGAYDNNSNGIADTPYTIYALNKDYGALLDTIQPTMGVAQITPLSQSLGGYTDFSITVTDNTKVRQVNLTVINPLGQKSNFSILQNKTGSTYSCRKQFLIVGNYTCWVAAKDPRNWVCTNNYTFSIKPGIPPVIKDNSPTTGSPASPFTFNTTVTSTNTVPSNLRVYVIWSHGSKGGNQTLVNNASNYFIATVTLDHSIANLTYHLYAMDQWGNAVVTSSKKVKIIDAEPPHILIVKHGPSSEDTPHSYTFGVTVTDNSVVSNVTIEYWYTNTTKMTAKMDNMGNNSYQKVIITPETVQHVFCVISATDIAGNTNNTMKPYAYPSGPRSGIVLQEITFNGTLSYDLDGTIESYRWDFGDGTQGNSSTPIHVYYANDTYTVTLQVVDNEGRMGNNTTQIKIGGLPRHMVPTNCLDPINTEYGLSLAEPFYCYDSDGDGTFDTFIDPNRQLAAVHTNSVKLNGDQCFLLSANHSHLPSFLWDVTIDSIIPVTCTDGTDYNTTIDEASEQATIRVTVEKAGWIYLETPDAYPTSPLTVFAGNRPIASNLTWRAEGIIYVLDDPATEYRFRFDHIYPTLQGSFLPPDGGVINVETPTITITYNVPVTIVSAFFDAFDMKDKLTSRDNMTFTYTPPGYLVNGTYHFEVNAQALEGNGFLSSTVTYFYFRYQLPPQKSFLEKNWTTIVFAVFVGAIGALLLLFKIKQVTVDAFIYIKNRKIIPFFKPVIIGSMSVQIDDQRLKKAEFYIDGQLKGETTTFPYRWQWDEKAFLRHTIETKVYDDDGNGLSSGAMEFYIFNLSERHDESRMTG